MSKIQWSDYRLSLSIILILFSGALCISQYCLSKTINISVDRIESVQQKLDAFYIKSDTGKSSTQTLAIQDARLELQKERIRVELEIKKQELFWYNIAFLGIGSFLGFISLLFLIPKAIEKQAKIEVEEKIGDVIRGRSKDVRKILSDYDDESLLRNTKRIFINGPDISHNQNLRGLLIENGFHAKNILIDEQTAQETGYDLLLINNINGEVLPAIPPKDKDTTPEMEKEYDSKLKKHNVEWIKLFEKIKSEKSNVFIFYYSEQNINFPLHKITDYNLKKRINFATNPAQIYGNLINSLKYQYRLSKS